MPGYVTSAERAAGVGEPEGGSLRPRAWRCAAGGTRGYLELCAGDPKARGLRGRLEAGSGDCPSARAGPQPAAVTLRFWTLDSGGGSSPAPGRPFRVRSLQTVLSPGSGPAIGPAGPTSLCFQLWAGAGVVLGGKQYRLYLGS